MHWIDWSIVWSFCLASVLLGLLVRRSAAKSLESYFVSNRTLGWWLAGTSIAATAFSSDTPLLLTGMVRRRGIWGVWEIWALGVSTMLTVFVFSRFWKRANVMTEVELVELRYSGKAASFLRGFKALYWGLFYNCYVMGVWPVIGMTKVLQETTPFSREAAILGSVILGAFYTSLSGLWGVVLTDAFQFVWAMVGAGILAWYSVQAVGGLEALAGKLQATPFLSIIPPGPTGADTSFIASPLGWLMGLFLIQWWAWKNADGGGVIVQRLVSCKDERHAMLSVLWFNIAHYCLRSWPWVVTALASIVLIPDATLHSGSGSSLFVDHERAYPRLITMLLPIGLRGVLVASFFAAFLSTLSTQLNWGASYLLNDGYKRFLKPKASERHYLVVARLLPWILAVGAMAVAYVNRSIGASFTLILNLTAGVGPVYLLRWFWWRINPWSEIAAMSASLPMLWLRPYALQWLGLLEGSITHLGFMVLATALVWLPVTLLTAPSDSRTLQEFYARVQPPGWWSHFSSKAKQPIAWRAVLWQWALGTYALLATTVAPLAIWFGSKPIGWALGLSALVAWVWMWRKNGGLMRTGEAG
ncbi:MAG: Na+:solute symporter [Candidatus Omnitrophica bacterium]|nr:Na+:solute symporter [Candidatus Omnitrophota bacterium]